MSSTALDVGPDPKSEPRTPSVDQDDLAAHAPRTRFGYVEPTQAARLLSWAPDFPGEAADNILRALTDVGWS